MKKFFTYLSLLALTLGIAPNAMAQYTIMLSTDAVDDSDDAVRYKYYINNLGGCYGANSVSELHKLYTADESVSGDIIIKRDAEATGGHAIEFYFKSSNNVNLPYSIYCSNVIKSNDGSYVDSPIAYKTTPTNGIYNVYVNGTSSDNATLNIGIGEKVNGPNNWKGVTIYCAGTTSGYLDWFDGLTNGIKVRSGGNDATEGNGTIPNNSGKPYGVFYFVPAAPAPMIFSKSAVYENCRWATYSTPIACTIPTNVTAYTASYTAGSDQITLTQLEGTVIPKNTGVLLSLSNNYTSMNANGKTVIKPDESTDTGTEPTSNLFKATCTEDNNTGAHDIATSETTTEFILSVGTATEGKIGFYTLDATERTIGAYKAYLQINTFDLTSQSALRIGFAEGNKTNISSTAIKSTEEAPLYDLYGRKVMQPTKGNIYIQNGKKLLNK